MVRCSEPRISAVFRFASQGYRYIVSQFWLKLGSRISSSVHVVAAAAAAAAEGDTRQRLNKEKTGACVQDICLLEKQRPCPDYPDSRVLEPGNCPT